MRKIYPLTILTALFLLLSCANEHNDITVSTESRALDISFSVANGKRTSTRATTDSIITQVKALDREKAVTRVDCFVFYTDSALMKSYKDVKPTGGTYTITLPLAGCYTLYVVANCTNPDMTGIKFADEEQFYQTIVKQTAGDNNKATNFVMLSRKLMLDVDGKKPTELGEIELTRMSARIDIDASALQDFKMSQVVFKNRYTQSFVARGQKGADMTGLASTTTTYKTPSGDGISDNLWRGLIYGYENMAIGKTETEKTTCLEITATYGTAQVGGIKNVVHKIPFENIPLLRNHLYNVIVLPAKSGAPFEELEYQIQVKDWETGETLQIYGDQLTPTSLPDFTLEGENMVIAQGANPSLVTVSPDSHVLKLRAVSKGSGVNLECQGLEENRGSIIRNSVSYELNGDIVTEFTINIKENAVCWEDLVFNVVNAVDKAEGRTFKVTHAKLPIEYVQLANVSNYHQYSNYSNSTGHTPSAAEWYGIVPDTDLFNFGKGVVDKVIVDREETAAIKCTGENLKFKSDYIRKGDTIYAIRFKNDEQYDSKYHSAHRYYTIGNDLYVEVVNLGIDNVTTLEQVAMPRWWEEHSSKIVTRTLQALGYGIHDWNTCGSHGFNRTNYYAKTAGYYCSNTGYGNGLYLLQFTHNSAQVVGNSTTRTAYSIGNPSGCGQASQRCYQFSLRLFDNK